MCKFSRYNRFLLLSLLGFSAILLLNQAMMFGAFMTVETAAQERQERFEKRVLYAVSKNMSSTAQFMETVSDVMETQAGINTGLLGMAEKTVEMNQSAQDSYRAVFKSLK